MMSSNKSVAFEIPKIDSGKDEGNVLMNQKTGKSKFSLKLQFEIEEEGDDANPPIKSSSTP